MGKLLSKHGRLALVVLGIAVIAWLLYMLRIVIFPFILGLVMAYVLMPIVTWLEKHLPSPRGWLQFRRTAAILIVFLVLGGLIAAFSYYIVTLVLDITPLLLEHAPYFFAQSTLRIQETLEVFRQQLPPEVRTEIDKALVNAGISLGNQVRDAFARSIAFVPQTFTIILGLGALPLFLFYILKDSRRLKHSFGAALPGKIGEHARNIGSIIEKVLGRWIRAQLMLGLIVGYFAFVGLLILGIPYAPALALLAGIGEMIPTLGPWISGGVSAIVTLAIAPDKTLWVILIFLVIQLFENTLLVPRIHGAYLNIHPAILLFLLVVGAYVAGFWGLLLAAPLTATIVAIVKYIRDYYEKGKSEDSAV